MKFLRDQLDRVEPLFKPGGRLEKLYPVYEATDTFLYTPGEVTKGPTHVRDGMDLKRMMSLVVVALVPAIFMACYNTGYQANRALATVAAVVGGAELPEDPAPGRVSADLLSPEQKAELATPEVGGWRGWVLGTVGVAPDPDSFLANLLHGMLWFVPVYFVTVAVGGTWEAIFSTVRGHEINEGFLVTSMLFPLTLPATIPLWQVALGISFGVVIGKEIFGGTGRNFLNPALTSRAFLYFAYPAQSTGDKVWNAATGTSDAAWDAYSSATTLNTMSGRDAGTDMANLVTNWTHVSWWDAFTGFIEGSMGETSTLAALIGAAVLIGVGVGAWRIMAGCVVGLLAFDTLLWLVSGDGLAWLGISEAAGAKAYPMYNIPPWYHLVVGGFAFGTVFMATDPVSSTWTKQGHWWYGILIGLVTVLIRVVNPAFPEGIMLAILFGNVFAPLIDHFVVQANVKRRLARAAATA